MNLAKGYWQKPMSEDSQQNAAFITEYGLFEIKRMSLGLVNSGATFTTVMCHVLEGLPTTDSFVDDIITHSEDFEGHLRDVREVLERLYDAKLTIKPSKCMLGYTYMEFLGHELGEGKLQPCNIKIKSIVQCERPHTKNQVRSFLVLIG